MPVFNLLRYLVLRGIAFYRCFSEENLRRDATGFQAQSWDEARLISVKCVALLKMNTRKDYMDTGIYESICAINVYYSQTPVVHKKS